MEYELVLTHHGIKGQRWGVRRFQTKSGGLTSAGRKRYGVGKDSDKKSAKKEEAPKKKKSISEMSDAELTAAINRARAEDTYRQLRPEKVSAGKRFISTLGSKVLAPVAIEQGKNFLNNYLSKLNDEYFKDKTPPSEKERLTKENELLKLRNENRDLKKSDDEKLSWADRLKQQSYEKNAANAAANKYKDKLEYEKSKKEYEDWMKENRSKSNSSDNDTPGHNPKIYVDHEFINSMVNNSTNSNHGNYTRQASIGETFIAGLLEAPKNR